MFRELIRPVSYLSISHPGSKVQVVNWLLPGTMAVGCLAVWIGLDAKLDIFGSAGLLMKLLGFIQSLPGFYLAALAAVSTFNNPGMDKLMPGTPPTARILHNGVLTRVQLTRRRMLSMMFAFLTAESFGLTLLAIMATTMAEPMKALLPLWSHFPAALGFLALYLLLLWQMLSVTLWGLFYLGERIHTPD